MAMENQKFDAQGIPLQPDPPATLSELLGKVDTDIRDEDGAKAAAQKKAEDDAAAEAVEAAKSVAEERFARLKAEELAGKLRGALAMKSVMSVHVGQAKLAVNDITDITIAAFDAVRAALDNLHGAITAKDGTKLVDMHIDALSRMAAAAKE